MLCITFSIFSYFNIYYFDFTYENFGKMCKVIKYGLSVI